MPRFLDGDSEIRNSEEGDELHFITIYVNLLSATRLEVARILQM